jgi:hypothetical protein
LHFQNRNAGKAPQLFPRKHFSWQRNVNDEIVRERAFAVDNGNVQAVALISNDPQLGEGGMFGAVSVYDFSDAKPVSLNLNLISCVHSEDELLNTWSCGQSGAL